MNKFHILGLDSLRAIAALAVLVGHIESIKLYNKISNIDNYVPDGHLGVILFFVISGFLITLLLLQEQKNYHTISIKKFYLRRILRIWPLYYFILLISSIALNYTPSTTTLIMCLTILPNVAHITNYSWAASPQIWSIGVEEQFYLIWPSLIKYIKYNLLTILILIILIGTFAPHISLFIIKKTSFANSTLPTVINNIYYTAKFNCMALGGLLAYLVHTNYKWLSYIRKTPFSYIFILLPFILWSINFELLYFTDEFYSVLFCLLIANITYKKYYFFENKVLNYLGKISYGIYMYHWISIVLIIKFLIPFYANNNYFINIILYTSVLITTISIASISYYTIERYFLNMKKRFERV